MYAWFWRHLPGPWGVRMVLSLLFFAAVVVLLFGLVFPAVESHLPFNDNTSVEPRATALAGLGA